MEMDRCSGYMEAMQSSFNAMGNTLKVNINKVDPGWEIATPDASAKEEEEYGPYEMAH